MSITEQHAYRPPESQVALTPPLMPSELNRFIPVLPNGKLAPFLSGEDMQRRTFLAKVEAEMGPIAQLSIPHHFLHGEYGPKHFKTTRLKRVNRGYRSYKNPRQMLLNNPIEAVFIPDVGLLPIFQGHHRARLAPNHGVTSIPALVHTLPQAVYLSNLRERSRTNYYDEDSLRHDLILRAGIAQELFLQAGMDESKKPYLVDGVEKIEELPEKYPGLIQPFELFAQATANDQSFPK